MSPYLLTFALLSITNLGWKWSVAILIGVLVLFLLTMARAAQAKSAQARAAAGAGGGSVMQALLAPIGELGPHVSASVYKLPASVKGESIANRLAQEPQLHPLLAAKQAIMHEVRTEAGEALFAFGGVQYPEIFEKVHAVLMSIPGVEFVVGMGPGSSTLPRTALGRAAVGAASRAKAA